MILPGILASQISGHLYSGPSGAYDALGSVTVGSGGLSSITFSAIPQTYTHLQIRGIIKNTTGATNPIVTFNGDVATNYAWHQLYGDGSSAGATASPTNAGIGLTYAGASQFSAFVTDILDYANTNKNKTVRSIGGADNNGSGYSVLASGVWFKAGTGVTSDAITSLTFTTGSTTFAQYSNFSLYGIR